MDRTNTDQSVAETMEHLTQHWVSGGGPLRSRNRGLPMPSRLPCRARPAPREPGWRAVGKRLELARSTTTNAGMDRPGDGLAHTSLLESLDEKRLDWMEEAFESFVSDPWVSETRTPSS